MMSALFKKGLLFLAVCMAALLQGCGTGGGGGGAHPVPVISNINGSATASGSANTTFIVYGTGFVTLADGSPVAGNTVDFRDVSTGNVVASASWLAGGWNNAFIRAAVPNTLTAGVTYDVTVTTPGGTSNAATFLVTASPSTISWAATTALPVALQGLSAVVAPITSAGATKTFVYALGGNTAASSTLNGKIDNVATVNINTVNDGTAGTIAGSLGATWSAGIALPAARGFAAAALANGFNSQASGNGTLYVLGGLDASGLATNTVYFASLNADGTTGAWISTTALPDFRYALGAAVFQGRIYVAGGADITATPTATVWSSPINADGTLGAWSVLPALPAAIAYHQLVTTGGLLYALGGTGSANVDPISNLQSANPSAAVYYNPINPADGSLAAAWTANPGSLIHASEKNTAVAIGGFVLVSGGLYSGASTGATEESYSAQSGNALGAFTAVTGSHTISGTTGGYDFFNHSAALYVDPTGKPHVLILGGNDVNTGALHAGVWYMP